jgi:MoxR-like ATPase
MTVTKPAYLSLQPGQTMTIETPGDLPEQVHIFDEVSIRAVNAAMAAKRPLLLRGDPGVGKSQLARAVAQALHRPLISFVVDMHTEAHDLLWQFDAMQRLAEAQLGKATGEDHDCLRQRLQLNNFIHPGPLWWAFDWQAAQHQTEDVLHEQVQPLAIGCDPANGCVVLIDEIDKAEVDVPNGLLEALGDGSFLPKGRKKPIVASGVSPLVVITTNEERALPDAFLRRCLVLHLDPFAGSEQEVRQRLLERGHRHFPELDQKQVIDKAVTMLLNDRAACTLKPLPGQAEFLDLLRAVYHLSRDGSGKKAEDLMDEVAEFVMCKQKGAKR